MSKGVAVKSTGVKYLSVPCAYEVKDETGVFTGYASVFGNVDLGGDVVERGAFKEMKTNSEGKIVTLWQHDSKQPIGTASLRADDHGLHADGRLVMEDPRARSALAHMKAKSVEGMSIGYEVLPGGAEYTEGGNRILKALRLFEISLVTWGMNPLAGVTSAKSRMCTNIREYEDLLRDECGFTHSQAKLLASGGWAKLMAAREETEQSGEAGSSKAVEGLLDYLHTIRKG